MVDKQNGGEPAYLSAISCSLADIRAPEQEIHLQQYDLHIIPPFIEHRHYIPQNKFCQYYCLHFDFYYDEDTADFSAVTEYSRYCSPEVSVMPINEDLKNRDVGTIGSLEFPSRGESSLQAV